MTIRFERKTILRLEKELQLARSLKNMHLLHRVWALLLLAEGRSIPEVARLLRHDPKTIEACLDGFLLGRFAWLNAQHYQGRGRKPRLTKKQKQRLYDLICDGPEAAGFTCGVWNSPMIVELIQREFNVIYHPGYLSDLLRKMGLSFQKARFISDRVDDREYQRARRRWDCVVWPRLLREARQKKGIILFVDEVSFAQWGSLARTWAPCGHQPVVKTCGKRKGLKMFGAIEFFSGRFHYLECPAKFNAATYQMFLEQILRAYPGPIFLIEDGAPYHRQATLNQFKEQMRTAGRLFVERLPTYSPDKNPIEKLWKNTKKQATHLKYFPTFEHLRTAVLQAFNRFLQDALQVVCVMKKLRQKAGLA
jgi:transposase